MPQCSNLFSEEYLAHYGVKGMKWGKHLPGVFPMFGNNGGTTTNYAGISRSTGTFNRPTNAAGYSHAGGTVKRMAEKRSGYTHATGTVKRSVEKSNNYSHSSGTIKRLTDKSINNSNSGGTNKRLIDKSISTSHSSGTIKRLTDKSINNSNSGGTNKRFVDKSLDYTHSSGTYKSAGVRRPDGAPLGVRVASPRPAAFYTTGVRQNISSASKVQANTQKPSKKLTVHPQKPTKISDQTWGTTLKNLGSAVSQTGRKAAVSVLSLIQNVTMKALRALDT